jgi:hypothetical protein
MSGVREPVDSSGQPLQNQALVDAMRAVSVEDTPERRALLLHLLLDSTLIVVTPSRPDAPGTRTARPGERLNLVTVQDGDGTVLPAFTSTAAVRAWRPEGAGIVALPARALLEMASGAGTGKIAINPGSATFGYLTRHEIEALAHGRLPLGPGREVVPEATQVRIGIPQAPPGPAALEALGEALRAEPAAERAWYYLMQQGQSPPELCVAVRLAPEVTGDRERAAMRAVIDRAGGHCEEVKTLLFTVADDELQANLEAGAGKQFFSGV